MKYKLFIILSLIVMPVITEAQRVNLQWGELPSIPNQFGFAGSYAGHSHGALVVAGGANFPDGGAPWTGSKKVWTDKIFVLETPTSKWLEAGKLPQPMGYGVSVSYGDKLIMIGGSNANGHFADVYAADYSSGKIDIETWPSLPEPLANSCGAVIGHTLYIAGGLLDPNAKSTADVFWEFDLALGKNGTWKKLETWPGPHRMLSVTGVAEGKFYLFSGTDLEDKNGAAHRQYLKDAYCYTPGKGWKKLADLPQAVVAAPGPAYQLDKNHLLVFGGDDGKLSDDAANLKEKHPGFSDQVLQYDIAKNKWSLHSHIKTDKKADAATNPNASLWAAVTNCMVQWQGMLVFPGGEVRPAIRTPRVTTVKITHTK